LKPAVLKTVRPERVSGVRIPPPPPRIKKHCVYLTIYILPLVCYYYFVI
jgi:hypothetical protein